MEACLPILVSYKKLQEQMAQGKYYSALKTLQEIEHGHLPGVMQFKFAEVIKNSFPKLRQVQFSFLFFTISLRRFYQRHHTS